MKKLIIFLIATTLILFNVAVGARDIASGAVMLLGDTSFDDSSDKISFNGTTAKTETTTFNVTGTYFINKNLGVGLIIGNEDSNTSDGGMTINESINLIGPIIDYNISLNDDTSLILHAGIISASGDMDDGTGNSANFDGDGTLLMASIAYFISDDIAVNFGIRKIDIDLDITVATLPASAEMSETATTIGLAVFF